MAPFRGYTAAMSTRAEPHREALEIAIQRAGSPSGLAEALGLGSAQVVLNWRYRGAIPPVPAIWIEQYTGGEVRASDLYPLES